MYAARTVLDSTHHPESNQAKLSTFEKEILVLMVNENVARNPKHIFVEVKFPFFLIA